MEIILLVLKKLSRTLFFSTLQSKTPKNVSKKLIKLNNDYLDQLGKQFVVDNLLRLFSLYKLQIHPPIYICIVVNNNNNKNKNIIAKAKISHSSDYFRLTNLCFSLNKWHYKVLLI